MAHPLNRPTSKDAQLTCSMSAKTVGYRLETTMQLELRDPDSGGI
jgi:hypothetical protein